MNKTISTFEKICQTATNTFAIHGYDVASLSMIAESVGIRKASLYSHFQSKNELFEKAFCDAYAIESSFMQNCYQENLESDYIGGSYCRHLPMRFEESSYLQLFLRVSFIAPEFLKSKVKDVYKDYLETIRKNFIDEIQKKYKFLSKEDCDILSEAYLGIIDSLHIELIYSNFDAFEKKRIAMLEVLSKAMQVY